MERLKICIDIDGTITPWRYYIDELNAYFKKNIEPEDFLEYDDTRQFGINEEMLQEFFENKGHEMHRHAPIRPLAAKTIERWDNGHSLYFITARREWTHPITLAWMEDYGIHHIPLYTMGTAHKTPKALELGCDLFLEDHPRESIHLAENGMKVFLMDAPYNRTCIHKNLHRIHDWEDAQSALEEFLETRKEKDKK